MFAFVWAASIRLGVLLRRLMPSNILLDAIHTRRGLKWGALAMLLAVPYLFAALLCAGLSQQPDATWLNLLVLVFVWDAL